MNEMKTQETTAVPPVGTNVPAAAYPAYTPAVPVKMSPEEEKKRVSHFCYFSIGSLIYAFFYTLCLYKNPSGITYPFFIGGTLFYFFLYLKKSGITAKKDSIFYITALLLLGISTFCTDDGSLLFMNKLGIFVLMFSFILHNLYQDGDWNLSKYLSVICKTVLGSVGAIGQPFTDWGLYLKQRKEAKGKNASKGRYVFFGLLLSIPLLIVVVALLETADMVFASFVNNFFINIRIPENLFGICFTLVFAFFASYCIIAYLTRNKMEEKTVNKRTGEPILAITVTAVLSVIYVIFSGIQINYLFLGNGSLPDNYTYSAYARQGFFQLLFVCLINLTLVLICLGRFKENRLLKILLTLISLCTYVMIASSAMRMIIYIKYYYLTFLRIFVLWALAVIFLLMTGVLVSIYREHFPLFKYSMAVVTVLYIGLSFSHPDYIIARLNTAYMMTGKESGFFETENGYSDCYYLKNLSADAAPALLSIDNPELYDELQELEESGNEAWWYSEYIANMKEKSEKMNLRTFNLSRYRAELMIRQNKY